MLGILQGTAQLATVRARPVPLLNLVSRWKFATKSLPEKDFNLRRDAGKPNVVKLVRVSTSDKFRIR